MKDDRIVVSKMEKQLDETWNLIDELLEDMSKDDWRRKHGPDWEFADLPWHLYYIDKNFVVIPTREGADLPEQRQLSFPSGAALNEWNDAMIASRPAEQTTDQSIAMMRDMRQECRDLVSAMSDASLDEIAWFPLLFLRGWRTKTRTVTFCFNHTYGHFMEARIRLNRGSPEPSPELVHARLTGIMDFIKTGLNKDVAAKSKLTVGMNFTGPGGGSWTIDVDHGQVTVEEKSAANPDLEMVQSPDTFEALAVKAINPLWAMVTRKIKVNGLRNFGQFSKLTTPPPLTQELDPI